MLDISQQSDELFATNLPATYPYRVPKAPPVETYPAGKLKSFTTPPDEHDWQVTYALGVQGGDFVITGLQIHSPRAEFEIATRGLATTYPPGGLSAQRTRALLRPGAALQDFIGDLLSMKVSWPMTKSAAAKLVAARGKGSRARTEPTAEVLEWIAWLRRRPRRPREPQERRRRLAVRAALYLEACAQGHRDPRARVARLQNCTENAVREDLYAARHEEPRLLASAGGQGRVGGTLTHEALALLKEPNASTTPAKVAAFSAPRNALVAKRGRRGRPGKGQG